MLFSKEATKSISPWFMLTAVLVAGLSTTAASAGEDKGKAGGTNPAGRVDPVLVALEAASPTHRCNWLRTPACATW